MVLLFVFFLCIIRTDTQISVKIILTRLVAEQSHSGKVLLPTRWQSDSMRVTIKGNIKVAGIKAHQRSKVNKKQETH